MSKAHPHPGHPNADHPNAPSGGADLPSQTVLRVLDAVVAVTSDLDLDVVLRKVVASAMDLTGAKYGALGVWSGGRFGLFVHLGMPDDDARGIGQWPQGAGLLGELHTFQQPIRVARIADHPSSVGFPPGHPQMESFLGVPIRLRDDNLGNLYLTEKVGGAEFTAADESAVVALASAAAAAIENARLYSQAKQIGVLEDRDRIARDLHDVVIQRLFASAMSLMSITSLVGDETARARIEETVSDLDETIGQIRSTIFALHTASDPDAPSIEDRLRATTQVAVTTLGFAPTLHIDVDPPGSAVSIPADLADQLVVALGEALTNVARHANAHTVTVRLNVAKDYVRLTVTDDGVGILPEGRRSGLRNLVARAHMFNGGCTALGLPGGGTELAWWARPDSSGRDS